MAADQRYCLECGERRPAMSSVLRDGPPFEPSQEPSTPAAAPKGPQSGQPREPAWQRNGVLTLLAGIGVLLLAMGVGVLIGRSGSSKQSNPAPQVITVNAGGGTGSAPSSGSEASFTGDWPAGTTGYTVQLQTLPGTGTSSSTVEAAKSAATAKGAKAVGALKSEEFSSLGSGNDYVIYSGDYHKRSEAVKALGGLAKSFPGAKVVHVANGSSNSDSSSSSSSSPEGGETTQPGGTGNSINHPAPPSVLEGLKHAKGKSYEEKSKSLPDVVSTG